MGPAKESGFDHLAMVIFFPDFRVKGAVLVPYSEIWRYAASSRYNRISYSQACQLKGAIDITADVSAAAEF